MFERMSNGMTLAKQSWRTLMQDKELLVFPLLSGIACLFVMASFVVPMFASGYLDEIADGDQTSQIVGYVILFAYYFVSYFVVVFFNAALVACAVIRFKGGDPTLADGFSASFSRLPQIAGWAFVSATIGLILRIIESRSERVGEIVSGLLGAAWSVMTYFVVPVLVVERLGPIDATKRSIAILRDTWGESLVAHFGIGFVVFLASLAGIAPIVLGGYLLSTGAMAAGIALMIVGAVILLIVSLVSSALHAIALGALYLYAAEGSVPGQFDNTLFEDAFGQRRRA